jgi:Na+-transporting methylmalonyl-CoA/oxaloacetate decarboxylase gamma subunit
MPVLATGCLSCGVMTRIKLIAGFALAVLLLLAVATPALGAETESAEDDTTETTVAAVPVSSGEEPAVVIPPPEHEQPEQPWTARFLIPLLVVTAIVVVIGVAIAYNRSVRHRYKVVT